MQDSGCGMWSQDVALILSIILLPPRVKDVNIFLNFGVKRTKFHLKADHFLGLKPYIRSIQ